MRRDRQLQLWENAGGGHDLVNPVVASTPTLKDLFEAKHAKGKSTGMGTPTNSGTPEVIVDKRPYRFNGGFVTHTPILPFQAVGVATIMNRRFFMLRDKTGLGKTIQAIYGMECLRALDVISRVIVVVPHYLSSGWQKQFADHLPGVSVQNMVGVQQKYYDKAINGSVYTIVPYTILSRARVQGNTYLDSVKALIDSMGGVKYGVILDDSQCITNPESKIFKAVCRLGQDADARVIINATPIRENLEDVWAQLFFLDRGERLGRTYGQFLRHYTIRNRIPLPYGGFREVIVGYKDSEVVHKALRSISLMRKPSRGMGIPEKRIVPLFIDPNENEREGLTRLLVSLYDSLLSYQMDIDSGVNVVTAKTKKLAGLIPRVIQASSFCDEKGIGSIAKLEAFVDRLSSIKSQAVVWGYYQNTVNAAEEYLRNRKIKVSKVHGGVSKDERNRAYKDFETGKVDVLCASYETTAMGRDDLKGCPYAFYLERSFRWFHEEQSLGRLPRIGGNKGFSEAGTNYCLFDMPTLSLSLDQYVADSVKEKGDRIGAVSTGNSIALAQAEFVDVSGMTSFLSGLFKAHGIDVKDYIDEDA